jgi:pimeloyl-ACP methyl ester carboxylesterase
MRRAVLLLTVLIMAAVAAAPASAAVRKGPRGERFYKAPKALVKKGRHGRLIWARKQTGPDALKGASRNELLLYRSTGVTGKRIAVSGSLALPKGRAPRGGWPVISYGHATDGIADHCAPTRGFDGDNLTSYAYPLLQRWLKAGYAVVRTDYEGLGTPGVHPFLVGRSEGRGVLDAVRAARAFEPRLSKRYVIAGHSQGGQAALFAASLAPKVVPQLRLRGTVSFAPPSHLDTQFRTITGLPTAGGGLGAFVGMSLRALSVADPGVDVRGLLTPQSAALYPATLTKCYDLLSRPDSFGGLPLNQFLRSGVDLDPLFAAAARNDAEHLSIKTPVRVEQGTADQTVFKAFTDQLVDEYERRGVDVTYKVYDGVTHRGVVDAAAVDSTTWIRTRLK